MIPHATRRPCVTVSARLMYCLRPISLRRGREAARTWRIARLPVGCAKRAEAGGTGTSKADICGGKFG